MLPRPKKSLGQHFLTNPQICASIAALLGAAEGDKIVEIGPGPGGLTSCLKALPHNRLLLIEKDSWWAGERQKEGGVEVISGDALQFDWLSLEPDWKLIGNLPYNIASPLIWDIVRYGSYAKAVFMTQKEVAERICAEPGSREYGALSVWIQCHAKPGLEKRLGPGAFSPPPKVDSAVISLEPLPALPAWPEALKTVLQICFQQRRKQLGGIFRRKQMTWLLAAMDQYHIRQDARPEQLSCQDYLNLAQAQKYSSPNK